MKVWIPQPLLSYTDRRSPVEADGRTLGELLEDLDRRFPGLRFRVVNEQGELRRHVRFFVDKEQVLGLDAPLSPSAEVHIFQSLSGG